MAIISDKQATVLLLGSFGSGNFGDDMLLKVHLRSLNKRGYTKFIVNYSKTIPNIVEGKIKIQYFKTKNPIALFCSIIKSAIVVIAGGTSIKQLYKSTGRSKNSTLFPLAVVAVITRVFNKQFILSHIGIGHLDSKFSKFLGKIILSLSTEVSLRDKRSFEIAKALSNKSDKLMLTADVAITDNIRSTNKINMPKTIVNVVHDIPDNININKYIERIRSALDSLSPLMGLSFINYNDDHDDRIIIEKVSKTKPQIITADDYYRHARISSSNIVILSRFHGIIYSMLLKQIFFAISYDIKCEQLLSEIEYPYWIKLDDIHLLENKLGQYIKRDVCNDKKIINEFNKYIISKRKIINGWFDQVFL